jgi:hypothetical protein
MFRCAAAQAVSRWLPTAAARVRVRAACGIYGGQSRNWSRFSPSTSVSLANHHSTNFSIIITRDWHNGPISGRSAEWTQLDSTPHYTNLKKIIACFYVYCVYWVCILWSASVNTPSLGYGGNRR